jgi:hypothetical protein
MGVKSPCGGQHVAALLLRPLSRLSITRNRAANQRHAKIEPNHFIQIESHHERARGGNEEEKERADENKMKRWIPIRIEGAIHHQAALMKNNNINNQKHKSGGNAYFKGEIS